MMALPTTIDYIMVTAQNGVHLRRMVCTCLAWPIKREGYNTTCTPRCVPRNRGNSSEGQTHLVAGYHRRSVCNLLQVRNVKSTSRACFQACSPRHTLNSLRERNCHPLESY